MKKKEKIELAMWVLYAGFIFWMIASWWEVNTYSLDAGHEYGKYNIFKIITEGLE